MLKSFSFFKQSFDVCLQNLILKDINRAFFQKIKSGHVI